MTPLLVSSGEPAGIGPDICLALAFCDYPIVILGDLALLESRAKALNLSIDFSLYQASKPIINKPGHLSVFSIPCSNPVIMGQLNPNNAQYVLDLLTQGAAACAAGEFAALITAPVHKGNINAAGIPFTGHTEFFAEYFRTPQVVMMLACTEMKVALVTTHLPLREVANAINKPLIINVIEQLHHSLVHDFGINKPHIKVAGLNPHAGESGYLGREEIELITPAIKQLVAKGMKIDGPLPADTMFTQDNNKRTDAYVAMYHDQGLPVLKYVGFHHAVNVTLGLPIIRTSVDHGTALELAGKGVASPESLFAAIEMAKTMVTNRKGHAHN